MLKRLNDALPELVLGIIVYGIVVELAGVWFVTDKAAVHNGTGDRNCIGCGNGGQHGNRTSGCR